MTALEALASVVGQEISDTRDEPLTPKQARYVAAALIVGMQNRGWRFHRSGDVEITLKADPVRFAATLDQVAAYLDMAEVSA